MQPSRSKKEEQLAEPDPCIDLKEVPSSSPAPAANSQLESAENPSSEAAATAPAAEQTKPARSGKREVSPETGYGSSKGATNQKTPRKDPSRRAWNSGTLIYLLAVLLIVIFSPNISVLRAQVLLSTNARLPVNEKTILFSFKNLALAYRNEGDLTKAYQLCLRVLRHTKKDQIPEAVTLLLQICDGCVNTNVIEVILPTLDEMQQSKIPHWPEKYLHLKRNKDFSRNLWRLAEYAENDGRYDIAARLYDFMVSIWHYQDAITTISNLQADAGFAYEKAGDYKQALDRFTKAYNFYKYGLSKVTSGPPIDAAFNAYRLARIGACLVQLGRYQEAEQILEQSLAMTKRISPQTDYLLEELDQNLARCRNRELVPAAGKNASAKPGG